MSPCASGPPENDRLLFAEENPCGKPVRSPVPWTVIIADDDPQVHRITRMVLSDYTYENRPLRFISTFSGKETLRVLRQEKDTAILLLDVVMETEDAGLVTAKAIRETLKNHLTRIILRTGQPGKAPEERVIMDYDINDYKSKTELTAKKLFSAITTALRSYRDLQTVEKNRLGIEQILNASSRLFGHTSLTGFGNSVMGQLLSLIGMDDRTPLPDTAMVAFGKRNQPLEILGAHGRFVPLIRQTADPLLPPELITKLHATPSGFRDHIFSQAYAAWSVTPKEGICIFYLPGTNSPKPDQRKLLRMFAANVAIALDNIQLTREMVRLEQSLERLLEELVERMDKGTVGHILRVGAYCHHLALQCGLDPATAENLRLAAPMHDIGKVGIPEAILTKKGPLTSQEADILRSHPEIGCEILQAADAEPSPVLKAASIIAHQHHERWDGTGYPRGLCGKEIHLFARITAIADVFDALMQKRSYKPAWSMEQAAAFLKKSTGFRFDPDLVPLFLSDANSLTAIQEEQFASFPP